MQEAFKATLKQASELPKAGGESPTLTARQFIALVGAQRRGPWIVARLRERLTRYGLETVPDFESAYIDGTISFVLAPK